MNKPDAARNVISSVDRKGDKSDLADIPGFDQLPGTAAVLGYATTVGLNTPTPLSVPYALDKLLPYLEQAAADVPS